MPRIYRTMAVEGDRPRLDATARGLGVRVPQDVPVLDGRVSPGTGGMSVAPAWRQLQLHRIPRRLKHLVPGAADSDRDAYWRMGEGPFQQGKVAEDLILRITRPTHGLVEPVVIVTIESYQASLAATRELWMIDEA